MSNLDCNISFFNTLGSKIPLGINSSNCLAPSVKTRSKTGPNFTPVTLSVAKKLQESQLNLLKFNYSQNRTTS